MNTQRRIYMQTLIFIGISVGIICVGCIFAAVSGIYRRDFVLMSVAVIALLFAGLVAAILIRYNRSFVNAVAFCDGNVVFVLNSGKKITVPKYAVLKITEKFSTVEIVCNQNGFQRTYRMAIRFSLLKKHMPDIEAWKKQLPGTYFSKSLFE